MPLPAENTSLPPAGWAEVFDQITINDAWYSSDVDALAKIYSGGVGAGRPRGDSDAYHYNKGNGNTNWFRRLIDNVRVYFTGQPRRIGEQRTKLHSPLAGNLATLSADVLFSDPPTVRMLGADGKTVKGAAQDRLADLAASPRTLMTLVQAAEWAAGLSAVALKVNWDTASTDRPWLDIVAADAVLPEWQGSTLAAVNLWTTYPKLTAFGFLESVYYHVERHEPGAILHAVYKGTETGLGDRVPIDDLEQTAYLLSIPGGRLGGDLVLTLPTGIEQLTCRYWRNLPTRTFRKYGELVNTGRADFEGVEHWLDQVDMVWSSWMRDIKVARARLIVPDTFLDSQGPGGGPAFDDDREILTALNYVTLGNEHDTIQAHQFEIRAQEHAASLFALTKEVLQHAGYSLASYGEHGQDVEKTATEVDDRKTATERTRDKKALYFVDAYAPLLEAWLAIDRQHYNQPGLPEGATLVVEFPEQSQIDPEKEARVFQYLRNAMAASTVTLVTAAHPDWEQDEIGAEVERIVAENAASLAVQVDDADPGAEGRTDPNADDDEGDEPPADDEEAA